MRASRYQRSIGSSLQKPMPPKSWTARSTTRPSVSAACTLTIAMSSRASRPWSSFQADCSTIQRAAFTSMTLSASIV